MLPSFRQLRAPTDWSGVSQLVSDVQHNFDLLKQSPRLIEVDPAVGIINFLVLEHDGTWNQWTLLAGAGVSFVQDNSLRTLTIKAP